MEANTGSLGMGISKAKGMAIAKRMKGYGGIVFVMTGDGELQEGQIWESLQTTAHQKINNMMIQAHKDIFFFMNRRIDGGRNLGHVIL